MLAEIAAANAAFAVIKEALNNGGELAAVGAKLGEYFGLKSEIQKKAQKGSEDFWALEKIKQDEEELKNVLIYQGRAGLWEDWLQFQADEKKRRDALAKEAKAKVQARREMLSKALLGVFLGLLSITGVGLIGLIVWLVMNGNK